MAKRKTGRQLGQEMREKVQSGEIVDPAFPSYPLLPTNPDAVAMLKHAIGLARRRGDAKAALAYSDKRAQFLRFIEDQRAREAEAIREAREFEELADRIDDPVDDPNGPHDPPRPEDRVEMA